MPRSSDDALNPEIQARLRAVLNADPLARHRLAIELGVSRHILDRGAAGSLIRPASARAIEKWAAAQPGDEP